MVAELLRWRNGGDLGTVEAGGIEKASGMVKGGEIQ
jgi:hypothetical protein